MTDAATLIRLRAFLLTLFAAGCLLTGAELWLVDHYEDDCQRVPLILLGAGLSVAAWNARRSGRGSVRAFQVVMLLMLVGSLIGLWLHYDANCEFELEMTPDLAGWDLFFEAIHGVSPPSLAPAALGGLGLIGLCWAYRHPALRDPKIDTDNDIDTLNRKDSDP
jgi:hypothetical protein